MNELRDVLSYDSTTGIVTWGCDRGNVKAGTEAGCVHPSGYKVIRFNRKGYPAHHVAWYLHYGDWPTHTIDHKDHDRLNNKIDNLRDVPQSVNQKNKRKNSRNTSGHNGITWHKTRKKYQARIKVNGKDIFLGYRENLEDAIALRAAANLTYRFSDTHGT